MKKIFVFIIITIIIAAAAGYLYYDWNTKTKRAALEPGKTVYSWTDEKGVKHFTDKEPPRGAKDLEKTTGFKYVKPPLVTTIKRGTLNLYRRVKYALSEFFKNIFKKRSKKKVSFKKSRVTPGVGVFFLRQDAGLLPAKPNSGNCLTIFRRRFTSHTQTKTDFFFCLFRRQ